MSRLVFILGAGCSAAAGAPTMPRFLDRAESILRSGQLSGDDPSAFDLVFRAYDCLQSIYSKSSEIDLLNIESLFAAFEMSETVGSLRGLIEPHSVSQLIPAITRTIVRTIERSVVIPGNGTQAPIPYGSFCEWVKSRPIELSVITFNYDLCLDWALQVAGLRPDYRLPNDGPEGRGSFDVLKLHGSLNWAGCERCGIIPKRLSELTNIMLPAGDGTARLTVADKFAHQTCSRCLKSFPREPVIVPPTWNKGGFSSDSMRTVWASAAKHLAEAEYIVIIGYSVPPTDHFFHYLYALGTMSGTRVKRIAVYNPDSSVEERYRRLLGPTTSTRFLFRSGQEGTFQFAIGRFNVDLGLM
jgi:NAD-dependent SIR2 family protein deacetylase